MGKKINELSAVTDAQAQDSTRLLPLCDSATGISGYMTMGQTKMAIAAFKTKYIATGAEGTTLLISIISGKEILMMAREGGMLYEVVTLPDPAEYVWDGSAITLGAATTIGERFLILYKNA